MTSPHFVVKNKLARQLVSGSLAVFSLAWACSISSEEISHKALGYSVKEIGIVPIPSEHAGRDGGFSGMLHRRSVWVFADTFLPRPAHDGLRSRSSSWSWTADTSGEDGIVDFHHALDEDGLAIQLLPHTSEEAAYNVAQIGDENDPDEQNCGSRHTPWPQALIIDPSGQTGVLFYLNMHTGPGGEWDFHSNSGSVASWGNPDLPAARVEPPLFRDEEPAALRL